MPFLHDRFLRVLTVKKTPLEYPHQWMQKIFHFAHLKPTFSILHIHFYKTFTSVYLFYTFIQIIFILLHFLLFSHSWPLSLSLSQTNHRHHHPATIKSKPRSVYLPCAFFVFILMIDWSQNLDEAKTQIKPKPRPIQPKTQG